MLHFSTGWLECFNFSIWNQHMKSDIPGYLWSTSSQIIFLSKALKFCKSTFSCLEDFLDKIFSILADYSGNSSNVITQPFKLSFWYCSWVDLERKAAQKTQKLRICLQQFWYHYQLWQRQYRNVKKCHFSLKLLWGLAKF